MRFWTAIRAFFVQSPERGVLVAVCLAAVLGALVYGAVSLASPDSEPDGSSAPSEAAAPDAAAQLAADAAPASAAPASAPLTAKTAAAVILEYAIVNCPVSQVVFRAPQDFPLLDAWEEEWKSTGRYALASSGPIRVVNEAQEGTQQDVLTHVNPINGTLSVRMVVTINKYSQVWFKQRQYFGCLVTPFAVNVLDTTLDPGGKRATVIFHYGGIGPTDFGNDMRSRAYPATNVPYTMAQQDPRWTQEHTAYLQKLDATGWRVESVR